MTGATAERPEILRDVARVLLNSEEIDGVAIAFNVAQRSEGQRSLHREQAQIFADLRDETIAPLLAFAATSGPIDPEVERILSSRGIPNLTGAREALAAMAHYVTAGSVEPLQPTTIPAPSRSLTRVLSGSAAFEVLEDAGFPVASWRRATTVEGAVASAERIGYPVAVKVDTPDITHKSDIGGGGGVFLNIADTNAAARAAEAALAANGGGPAAVVVQKMAGSGIECLIGVTRDRDLGLQVVLSPGGPLVELVDAPVTRLLPVGPAEAEEMIRRSVLSPIVDGYRGGRRADRKALIAALCRLSDLAVSFGEDVEAIDVNPFILFADGSGGIFADGSGGIAVDAVLIPTRSGRDRAGSSGLTAVQ